MTEDLQHLQNELERVSALNRELNTTNAQLRYQLREATRKKVSRWTRFKRFFGITDDHERAKEMS
jgi:hypothetical protein